MKTSASTGLAVHPKLSIFATTILKSLRVDSFDICNRNPLQAFYFEMVVTKIENTNITCQDHLA